MVEWNVDAAHKLLDGVIPAPLLDAYCLLLGAEAGCPVDSAEGVLGDSALIQALKDRGMAHIHSNPTRLIAAAPDLALQGALVDLERRLIDEHRQLMTGHKKLGEMQRTRAAIGGICEQLVEVVTDRNEIRRTSDGLINTARHDWMTLENLLHEIPIDESNLCVPLPAFEGTVLCRSIYEAKYMEQSVTAHVVEAAVAAGERARLLPQVAMKMKLADETVAMLPLTPTGMSGALIIRSPVVVGALRQYFEMLWEQAVPIGGGETDGAGLSDTQRRVLHLLAAGLQDEAIARRLSVSVNTVRRYITDMRELLNVDTRFAMGAAAHRRGWIE